MSKLKIINLSEGSKEYNNLPSEWCFGNGVLLDFHLKTLGFEITKNDIEKEFNKIKYIPRQGDIVLFRTKHYHNVSNNEVEAQSIFLSSEITEYLYEIGIRVIGIDSDNWSSSNNIKFNNLLNQYFHIENLYNLNQLPSIGFKVAILPEVNFGEFRYTKSVAMLEY